MARTAARTSGRGARAPAKPGVSPLPTAVCTATPRRWCRAVAGIRLVGAEAPTRRASTSQWTESPSRFHVCQSRRGRYPQGSRERACRGAGEEVIRVQCRPRRQEHLWASKVHLEGFSPCRPNVQCRRPPDRTRKVGFFLWRQDLNGESQGTPHSPAVTRPIRLCTPPTILVAWLPGKLGRALASVSTSHRGWRIATASWPSPSLRGSLPL